MAKTHSEAVVINLRAMVEIARMAKPPLLEVVMTVDEADEIAATITACRKALGRVMEETGTSTLAHHIARDALAAAGGPKRKVGTER